MRTIAQEDWPATLPDRNLIYYALWKTARQVASTFQFASRFVGANMVEDNPVTVRALVDYGEQVILTYSRDEFSYLIPTLRADMINEAARLMRAAEWEYDTIERRWYRKVRPVADAAPWLFGRGLPNDRESSIFCEYEDRYPYLVALARMYGNVTHAAEDLGVDRAKFYRNVRKERVKAASDAELMARLKK